MLLAVFCGSLFFDGLIELLKLTSFPLARIDGLVIVGICGLLFSGSVASLILNYQVFRQCDLSIKPPTNWRTQLLLFLGSITLVIFSHSLFGHVEKSSTCFPNLNISVDLPDVSLMIAHRNFDVPYHSTLILLPETVMKYIFYVALLSTAINLGLLGKTTVPRPENLNARFVKFHLSFGVILIFLAIAIFGYCFYIIYHKLFEEEYGSHLINIGPNFIRMIDCSLFVIYAQWVLRDGLKLNAQLLKTTVKA
jgi:hypothetical protein